MDSCDDDDAMLENDEGAIYQLLFQASAILALSHLLHCLLRRLGQPSNVSQILAGVILGPTILGRLASWSTVFKHDKDYLVDMALVGRVLFMFLMGLEIDIPYLIRNAHRSGAVAAGGALACLAVAAASSSLVFKQTDAHGSMVLFVVVMTVLYSNTSTPMLARAMTELKLAASEVGRLAISVALINDIACLALLSLTSLLDFESGEVKPHKDEHNNWAQPLMILVLFLLTTFTLRPVIRWINQRNHRRRHVNGWEAFGVTLFMFMMSMAMALFGYSNIMAAFVIGVVIPREGAMARTLVDWLTFPVNNVILPIYFGYAGLRTDLGDIQHFGAAMTIVVFGLVGKVGGTVLATKYLGISFQQGLVLGFLLNVKGHVDMMVLVFGRKAGIWDTEAYSTIMMTIVLNTLSAGPVANIMVRVERRALMYRSVGLEWQPAESELRLLSCLHSPRDLPTTLALIELADGTAKTPLSVYVMHLVEHTTRVTTAMLYHQQQDDRDATDWEYGGNNARRISNAIDTFRRQTGIRVFLSSSVSGYSSMHQDVINGAADSHATMVVLPFHKYQRIDGKMSAGKPGPQTVNKRVLYNAPCTVGILVDRGLRGRGARHDDGEGDRCHVVAIFLGGPDDREALAFAGRLAVNPTVSLTVLRFIAPPRNSSEATIETMQPSSESKEVHLPISKDGIERDADETFLSNFCNRFVSTGIVSYAEKKVAGGPELVRELTATVGVYSLFVVGKGRGRTGLSPLMVGLSEWVESPELGVIGDLLASSDFMTQGSVLVIQQYDRWKKDDIEEELFKV